MSNNLIDLEDENDLELLECKPLILQVLTMAGRPLTEAEIIERVQQLAKNLAQNPTSSS